MAGPGPPVWLGINCYIINMINTLVSTMITDKRFRVCILHKAYTLHRFAKTINLRDFCTVNEIVATCFTMLIWSGCGKASYFINQMCTNTQSACNSMLNTFSHLGYKYEQ